MTEFPSWVVYSAGVFFIVQIVLTICLIVAVIRIVGVVKEVAPKVEAISVKVTEIGDKVEDLTETVRSTAETVGARAKSISGSAESIAQTAATSFEKFSPYVVGILSAVKILRALQGFRATAKKPEGGHSKAVAKVDRKGPK